MYGSTHCLETLTPDHSPSVTAGLDDSPNMNDRVVHRSTVRESERNTA